MPVDPAKHDLRQHVAADRGRELQHRVVGRQVAHAEAVRRHRCRQALRTHWPKGRGEREVRGASRLTRLLWLGRGLRVAASVWFYGDGNIVGPNIKIMVRHDHVLISALNMLYVGHGTETAMHYVDAGT